MQRGSEKWASRSRRRSSSPDHQRDRNCDHRRDRDYQPSVPPMGRDPRSWGQGAASSNSTESTAPRLLKPKSPPAAAPTSRPPSSSSSNGTISSLAESSHVKFFETLSELLSARNDVDAQAKKVQQLREFVEKAPARKADYEPKIAEAGRVEHAAREQLTKAWVSFAEEFRALQSSAEGMIKKLESSVMTTKYQTEATAKRVNEVDGRVTELAKYRSRMADDMNELKAEHQRSMNRLTTRIGTTMERVRANEVQFDDWRDQQGQARPSSRAPAVLDLQSQEAIQGMARDIRGLDHDVKLLRERMSAVEKRPQSGIAPGADSRANSVSGPSSSVLGTAGHPITISGDKEQPAAASTALASVARDVKRLKGGVKEHTREIAALRSDLRFEHEEAMEARLGIEQEESVARTRQLVEDQIRTLAQEHKERRLQQTTSAPLISPAAPPRVESNGVSVLPSMASTMMKSGEKKSASPSVVGKESIGMSREEMLRMFQQAMSFQKAQDADARAKEEKDRLRVMLLDPEFQTLLEAVSSSVAPSVATLEQKMEDMQAGFAHFKEQLDAERERHKEQIAQVEAQREAGRMALQQRISVLEEGLRKSEIELDSYRKYNAGHEKALAVHGLLIHGLTDVITPLLPRRLEDTQDRAASSADLIQQQPHHTISRQTQMPTRVHSPLLPQHAQTVTMQPPQYPVHGAIRSPMSASSPGLSSPNPNGHTLDPRTLNINSPNLRR